MHFLIEAKSLLSSPGKMIGEQYKIIGIAQAETIRHKRDLQAFIERSLQIKKRYFKTFSEDRINVSGPGQVRVEMYTKILDRLLSSGSWGEVFFIHSQLYENNYVLRAQPNLTCATIRQLPVSTDTGNCISSPKEHSGCLDGKRTLLKIVFAKIRT